MPERSQQLAYPIVTYEDADAGIEWLKSAFGAKEVEVYRDGEGKVAHLELEIGGAIVMGGTRGVGELAGKVEIGHPTSVYLVTAEPDALHARAEQAGAEMVIPLRDEDYGSRGFTARDPEGNLWSFGTYRPEVG